VPDLLTAGGSGLAAQVLVPSRELASKHYAEHDGKPFFPKLVDFLSSGAVVVRLSAFALLFLPSS
jgi:nucleoside diphosphate kinase